MCLGLVLARWASLEFLPFVMAIILGRERNVKGMFVNVLMTGASGFVGSELFTTLKRSGVNLETLSFSKMLDGQDVKWTGRHEVCIHLAARVHVMNDAVADPLSEFRRCNVEGTVLLARQAAAAGVRRFVFVSSVKVNGEATNADRPYSINDVPMPRDAYGISKLEAEVALRDVAMHTGMEVVIIRPPLVYGPGVKANFAAMMRLIYRGIPLPIGAIQNKRSMVCLDNLVNLIETCSSHPAAANQTFFVSDGIDMSTPELATRIGGALNKPARLVSVPVVLLNLSAGLLGRSAVAQRLCGSLQVDISKTREVLGWSPPVSIEEGLRKTAENWINLLSKEA